MDFEFDENVEILDSIPDSQEDEINNTEIEDNKGKESKGKGSHSDDAYFRIQCKDNGVGMSYEDIPNMLGIGKALIN